VTGPRDTTEADEARLATGADVGSGSTGLPEGRSVAADNVLEFPETAQQSRRRRRRKWWLGGLGALVLLGVLGAVLYFSPLLSIQTVTVTGTSLVPQERAEERLQPVLGRPLPQVGQRTVKDLLAEEPAVADVLVHAKPPSSLNVEVIEHEPVAMVSTGNDRVLYGANGQELATLTAEEAERHGLSNVSSVEDVNNPEVFSAITSVLGTLPEPIRNRMESASARTVDSVTLHLDDGRTVLWGNAEQGERKAQVLKALLKVPVNEEAPVREFDVSTPDHPVTRSSAPPGPEASP
jgi:cell division protein FtsQ